MLSCRIFDNFEDLKEIIADWDRLVSLSEFSDVFATSGFARAWWQAYGDGKNLKIIVVEDENFSLKLVAPFYSFKTASQILYLIGDPRADYNNLIYEKKDHDSLSFLFSWLEHQNFWQRIIIKNNPAIDSFLQCFPRAISAGTNRFAIINSLLSIWQRPIVVITSEKFHPIVTSEGIPQLAGMLASKKYRKRINGFGKNGQLDYKCIMDTDEIKHWLPVLMDLHIDQWHEKGEQSLFTDEKNQNFYYFLLDEMDKYNTSILDLLFLDGDPIAAHFGFIWSSRLYYYKPCYALKYSSYSPGKLLLLHIFRNAAIKQLTEIDFLAGREDYKDHYATNVRPTGSITIYRSRLYWLKSQLRKLIRV
jgi:CelD/BcsL family acetyltransferase involved in cellulose biosynthesis